MLMLILLLKILVFDNFKLWQLGLMSLIIILAIYSWRKSQITSLMVMVAYILSAKNIEFTKIVKRYFDVNFVMLIGVSIYSLLGIIKNLGFERNGIVRQALGIDYPTDLAAYVLYLALAYCFLKYDHLRWYNYFGLLFLAFILNLITNARLDVYTLVLSVIIFIIAKRAQHTQNNFSRVIVSNFWALSLVLPYIYLLLTYYYNPSNRIFSKLNDLLSGRLLFGHVALSRYGITMFGQHIQEQGWGGVQGLKIFKTAQFKYFFIDSTYIRLLVIYGVILAAFIVTTLVIISVRETLKHNYVFPAIILIITISSLIDQHLIEITYNPFLLALLADTYTKSTEGNINNEKAVQD
ncbi:polymerase [Limosilactobacillus reuteri]|uniref:polymerase n=1 Tax=Limosilactobacillus reuteri TaxID=1598 RepID=UPI0025520284|nr:polymerase [Limosilactobacillus reuteri]MDL2058283.1 polymerase [Limosilactobacillus reuteri]